MAARKVSRLLMRVFDSPDEQAEALSALAGRRMWIPPAQFTLTRSGSRAIGAGAAGQVLAAEMDGTPVALKQTNAVWFEGLESEEAMRDFRRETRLLMSMSHPNIVRFFGVTMLDMAEVARPVVGPAAGRANAGRPDGPPNETGDERLFMVTELCSPGGLDGVLRGLRRRGARTPDALRLQWAFEIVSALEYLHRAGLMHGDIKPANVLVDGPRSTAKVCDFGLTARVKRGGDVLRLRRGGGERTRRGRGMRALPSVPSFVNRGQGTPAFMAPELLATPEGETIDMPLKADVWAFGGVLWCILATRPEGPFGAGATRASVAKRLLGPPEQRAAMPDVETGGETALGGIVRKCWMMDPADRPSFDALLARLRRERRRPGRISNVARSNVARDPPAPPSSGSPGGRGRRRRLLLLWCLCALLNGAAVNMRASILPDLAAMCGVPTRAMDRFFLACGVGGVAASLPAGLLTDGVSNPHRLIALGLAARAAVLLAIPRVASLDALCALAAVMGATFPLVGVAMRTCLVWEFGESSGAPLNLMMGAFGAGSVATPVLYSLVRPTAGGGARALPSAGAGGAAALGPALGGFGVLCAVAAAAALATAPPRSRRAAGSRAGPDGGAAPGGGPADGRVRAPRGRPPSGELLSALEPLNRRPGSPPPGGRARLRADRAQRFVCSRSTSARRSARRTPSGDGSSRSARRTTA
jgi:serine/threonine protein kinase